MKRRTLLASMAGTAALGACSARDAHDDRSGRPTLAIVSEGSGRWRVRSWQQRGGAWRPAIAHVKREGGTMTFSGNISAADRADVIARLRA